MNIVESIMTENPCYTAGKTITVKGIMLHSVGCAQPDAQTFIKNWNKKSYTSACVHAFIDGNDGTVYQTLPWERRGWHCGSGSNGSGNDTHIGVEMCEPACIKYTSGSTFSCSDKTTAKAVAKRTYEAAVELFASLCKTYSLDPAGDGVIISHKEGNERGIASSHVDPEHLWEQLGLSYSMDGFRADVAAATASEGDGMTDEEMFSYLVSQGFGDFGAAGIMGNLFAESSLISNNLQDTANKKLGMTDEEYTAAVDGGTYGDFAGDGYGYGLAQWTYGPSKQSLLDFAHEHGASIGSTRMQCEFLVGDISGNDELVKTLKNATSVKDASDAVLTIYEKPKNQSDSVKTKRANFAQGYYDKYASGTSASASASTTEEKKTDSLYRVRKSWDDAKTQKGAYKVLSNAKACADKNSGYFVFDPDGNAIYPEETTEAEFEPYKVKVSITNLNIRTGAGTGYKSNGHIAKGVYTIVEESDGEGASKWGKLKSGAGWISLDYVTLV